jgi:hypothetical protein
MDLQTATALVTLIGMVLTVIMTVVNRMDDKRERERRDKLDQDSFILDKSRTREDIEQSRLNAQIQLNEAQSQQIEILNNQVERYSTRIQKIGLLFDDIECKVGNEYRAEDLKIVIQLIRKTRQELGI